MAFQPTKKFNLDVIRVEGGDEEKQLNYLTIGQVENVLLKCEEGDDVVVHCLGRQQDLYRHE